MRALINWIKPSFEDDKGSASYRRLTAFTFAALDLYIVGFDKVDSDIMLHVHYSILVFVLLLIGIVTVQNILTFFKKSNDESK